MPNDPTCTTNTEVVLGGGFDDAKEVWSTNQENDLRLLHSSDKEADTRTVLHAVHSTCDKVVVYARDTYVFLLLLHHFTKINCKEIWLMAGTAKQRKFFPVHKVFQLSQPEIIRSLLAFHTLTRCDTTSYIAGHTKRGKFCSTMQSS